MKSILSQVDMLTLLPPSCDDSSQQLNYLPCFPSSALPSSALTTTHHPTLPDCPARFPGCLSYP